MDFNALNVKRRGSRKDVPFEGYKSENSEKLPMFQWENL